MGLVVSIIGGGGACGGVDVRGGDGGELEQPAMSVTSTSSEGRRVFDLARLMRIHFQITF